MEVISVQPITDRPIIDAIAPDDFMLIGDASDNNVVKRVLVSTLAAYFAPAVAPEEPTQWSVFTSDATPEILDYTDGGVYEIGMRFEADRAGFITAIRYYKATSESGSHTGNIWSNSGTLLASVEFTDTSTEAGWKQQNLTTPLAIAANTPYVVSVNANSHLANRGLGNQVVGSPLTIIAASLYFWEIGGFPSNEDTAPNENYFRDVVFV